MVEYVKVRDNNLIDYIDKLKKLKEVDRVANSKHIDPKYESIIDDFTNSWMNLKNKYGTTVPNKVHIITTHLKTFMKKQKTLYQKSDQTVESIHQEFEKRLVQSNYKVKNFRSQAHGIKLQRGTIHFNAYNFSNTV